VLLLEGGQELSGAVDAVSAVGLRLATVGSNGPGGRLGLRDIRPARAHIREGIVWRRPPKPNLAKIPNDGLNSVVPLAGGAIGLNGRRRSSGQ